MAVRPQDPIAEMEQFQQFMAEIEPLVHMTAPQVGNYPAFLGWLHDLLPSHTPTAQELTLADWVWLQALDRVVHDQDLCFELITRTGEEDALYLVLPH